MKLTLRLTVHNFHICKKYTLYRFNTQIGVRTNNLVQKHVMLETVGKSYGFTWFFGKNRLKGPR